MCCCAVCAQVSANVFSTKPALQVLQGMTTVPMAEELVHLQTPRPVSYMSISALQQVGCRNRTHICSICAQDLYGRRAFIN